jgi:uncharacterized protein YjbI with pentapeptide repeats
VADDGDLALLMAGEKDLTGCDFRKADLVGVDLRGRSLAKATFDHARIGGANFSGVDLSEVSISWVSAEGASFERAMKKGVISFSNFRNANFREAKFSGCHFQGTDFTGADFRGADFSNASFNDNDVLDSVVVDDHTLFDGVKILRALAKAPAFANYVYDKGTLRRREDAGMAISPAEDGAPAQAQLSENYNDVINAPLIESSSWTGRITTPTIRTEQIGELARLLEIAERDLDDLGAGNSEKAQARAYIVAARALADAPDPQTDLVWELISRANQISGIASLFIAVLALFVH